MKALAVIVLLVACSSNSGDPGNGGAPDAPAGSADAFEFHDAPPNVPMNLMLSGKTSEQGLSGTSVTANVAIAAFKVSDDSMIAQTTSDAQGNYTLTIQTTGAPIDGYLKATKSGYVDIYLYPNRAWQANDATGDINMMTPGNKDLLNNFASGGQMAGKGMVGLAVYDAQGHAVSGATITAMPSGSTVRYTGSNGLPSSSAMSTSADGVAFLFNAPENVTVTATKAGMTFHAHVVKARADKFTTTSVAP
jgi:hypothetical protein